MKRLNRRMGRESREEEEEDSRIVEFQLGRLDEHLNDEFMIDSVHHRCQLGSLFTHLTRSRGAAPRTMATTPTGTEKGARRRRRARMTPIIRREGKKDGNTSDK